MEKIRLGISSCLLGYKVRYDGGHKLDPFLTETLGRYVEYVPVCPEVECGLGVPRESMRLVGDPANPRLVTTRTKDDHTARMARWAHGRIMALEREDLCGFIFKKDSPSCGMARVKVYDERGGPERRGTGIFARMFRERFPLLPVEDEGRLRDPDIRENFIARIFVLKRFREDLKEGKNRRRLLEFHTRHKLLILAHSERHYRAMGKLIARIGETPLAEAYDQYRTLLTEALQLKTTMKKNVNVLQHMMGFFKRDLSPDEKRELVEIVDSYRTGILPLIVPLTLVAHYVRRYDHSYLKQQVFINPHPLELRMRNHV